MSWFLGPIIFVVLSYDKVKLQRLFQEFLREWKQNSRTWNWLYLFQQDVEVKKNAAAALMFVMCKTEAKLRCLKLKTPLYLIRCAQFFNQPALQLNAIKALTSFAESPDGQNLLKSNFHLIQDIMPADAQVKRHKSILITVIYRVI